MKIEDLLKENTKLDRIYSIVKKSNHEDKWDIIEYLDSRKNSISIIDDDVLIDFLAVILEKNISFDKEYMYELYKMIVYDKNNSEQKGLFIRIYSLYFKSESISLDMIYIVYHVFENKKCIFGVLNKLNEMSKLDYDVLTEIHKYIINARQYYVDEAAFFSSCIKTIDEINDVKYNIDEVKKVITREIKKSEKIAGVYNIDEEKLESLPIQIEELSKKQLAVNEQIDKSEIEQSQLDEKIKESISIFADWLLKIDEKKNEFKKDILIDLKETVDILKDIMNDYKSFNSKDINPVIDQLMTKIDYLTSKIDNDEVNNNENSLSLDDILATIAGYCEIIDIEDANNKFKRFINMNDKNLNKEELEIKNKVLSSIETIKNINSKTYKISDDNVQKLLSDDEQILKSKYDYLKSIYYVLYNNNLDIFIRVPNLKFLYYNKEITKYFEKNIYLSLLLNNTGTLQKFIGAKEIPFLASFFYQDPSFNIKDSIIPNISIERLKEIESIFGMQVILKLTEKNNENMYKILRNTPIKFLRIYKIVLVINPSFEVYINSAGHSFFEYYSDCFSPNEIANLTMDQQIKALDLYDSNNSTDLYIFNQLVFSDTKAYISRATMQFLTSTIFDFSVEEYIELDYQISSELISLYNNYIYFLASDKSSLDKAENTRKLLLEKIKYIRKIFKGKKKIMKYSDIQN